MVDRFTITVKAKHNLLQDILGWLPACKDYPEWKQKIIEEHNRWHKLDEEVGASIRRRKE